MDNSTEKWVERVTGSAEIQTDYYRTLCQDNGFLWGRRLRSMLRMNSCRDISGVWLKGPEGSGRHIGAAYVVDELAALNYQVLFLPGERDEAITLAGLQDLIEKAYDARQGMCLVLDRTECWEYPAAVLSEVGQLLCEYHLQHDLPPLFALILDRETGQLPYLLRSRLHQVRLGLPNRERRMEFFQTHGLELSHYVDQTHFLAVTEGFRYDQMGDVLRNACIVADETGTLSQNDLEELAAAERRPQPLPPLWQAALERVDAIVNALSRGTAPAAEQSVPAREAQPSSSSIQEQLDAMPTREDVFNMPVKNLVQDLFGPDALEKMDRVLSGQGKERLEQSQQEEEMTQ